MYYVDQCIVGSIPNKDGQFCVVCMLLYAVPSFGRYQEHSYSNEELTFWEKCSLPLLYVYIDHRHWFYWTAVWLQLHISLVYVNKRMFIRCVISQWFGVTTWAWSLRWFSTLTFKTILVMMIISNLHTYHSWEHLLLSSGIVLELLSRVLKISWNIFRNYSRNLHGR